MALEAVGGAFLNALLSVLFDRIASCRKVVDIFQGQKVTDELLMKLNNKLQSVNAVLNDAEEKQIRNPEVRDWLDGLKDTLFHAEHLLDEINTEARRRDLEVESGSRRKVPIGNLNFDEFDKTLEPKIAKILSTLEFILSEREFLGLKEVVENRPEEAFITTSLVDESGVYGRDEEKEAIIKLLLSDDAMGNKVNVIPIVGMGGIGKTTLAQLVYNNDRVKLHFPLRAWVCFSRKFDVLKITQLIYESITQETCDITNLELLQGKLKLELAGKKFLFVYDDVWDVEYIRWEDSLRCLFEHGAHGSKIIVTARNGKVASTMGTLQTHYLTEVCEQHLWLIFKKHAFRNADVSAHPGLAEIGEKIVRKYKGHPLAAKSLGGLLRSELRIDKWENILNSDIWELSETNILPTLWLSYYYLPPPLKRCFAYCSIFPKEYEFKKSELVLLWMAEDLLQPKSKTMMEEVGEDYFDDLASRSFFQRVSSYHETTFTMHGLLNDLAKFVSGGFCFRLEDNDLPKFVSKTRHFSYMQKCNDWEKFQPLKEAKYLRTFLPLKLSYKSSQQFEMSDEVLYHLLPTLQCLKVLNLSNYDITELPDSISNLKYLRYLDLSYTSIKQLPDTICGLCNLQTLLLLDCKALDHLPTNLGRLINLRHLHIRGTKLKQMPPHMSKLKDLQVLGEFVLDKDTAYNIVELKELQYIRGRLRISGLCYITDATDALKANMRDKKYLNELVLEWGEGDTDDSTHAMKVLENLQPQANLKKLTIDRYGGTNFPDWVGGPAFFNLVFLRLVNCRDCWSLPKLEHLASLKELEIEGLDMVLLVGPEFVSRSLQVLKFENMREWRVWSNIGGSEEGGGFPNLSKLCLRNCPNLTGRLPLDYFPKLECLELSDANQSLAISQELNCPKKLSLCHLSISACQEFVCFPNGGLHAPNLREINIFACKKLRSLPEQMHTLLPSLQSLSITGCPELESFPEEGLPPSLRSLDIHSCKNLIANRMQWGLQRLSSLRRLSVDFKECEEADSFPEEGLLPANLTSLFISNILNVTTMDGRGFRHLTSLEQLTIAKCPMLECLQDERLPAICDIQFRECPSLIQ